MRIHKKTEEWVKCHTCNGKGKLQIVDSDWYCDKCGKLTSNLCSSPDIPEGEEWCHECHEKKKGEG